MASPDEPVWSVSDVNGAVKDMLENSFRPFWLRGEVSNLLIHRSGHVYLSLKDEKTQIRAAFFGGSAAARQMNLQNGALIECFGRISVYEVRGEYQFSIRSLRQAGIGDLQRRFEELKQRLNAEGLFAPERKSPIPQLPACIGVVTSPTGAAIRDFLQIVNRRFPDMRIKIYPAQVQGRGAEMQIAAGVDFFNRTRCCDVIVVTRGGGSIEDLWPFNEETVVRSVAASAIPVISAVGHEIDFTLCDFAADLRVPTPSAAAELVTGSQQEFRDRLHHCASALRRQLDYRMLESRARLDKIAAHRFFREPGYLLENCFRRLDDLQSALGRAAKELVRVRTHRLDTLNARLEVLSPQRQLERGYALVTDASGHLVSGKDQTAPGAQLLVQLADGRIGVTVDEIK